ncbi:MAG: hypothetical protein V1911_03670 [Candidatus Micrarchaeota archaeon]
MDDNSFLETALIIILALFFFRMVMPGSETGGIIMIFAAIAGALLVIYGVFEFFINQSSRHIAMGAAICIALIVLFNGTGLVTEVFSGIFRAAANAFAAA